MRLSRLCRSAQVGWQQAVASAEKLVDNKGSSSLMSRIQSLLSSDLSVLREGLTRLATDRHPLLNTVSTYYFQQQGKNFRPIIVLLLARALSGLQSAGPSNVSPMDMLAKQQVLAESTELIHTASLFHDDVVDQAELRRSLPSATVMFGNKLAVLGGDYLFAKASLRLSELRSSKVSALMARSLGDLVEGEVIQARCSKEELLDFDVYMRKTELKTASLIARSCQSVAVLGGYSADVEDRCHRFGRHFGIAFQLVDDTLDLVSSTGQLGKPSAIDLKLGLATAPVLFAAEQFPDLKKLILRRFSEDGDVGKAQEWVASSNGVQRTLDLAASHCKEATDALSCLPVSKEHDFLIELTRQVLTRKN